MKGEVEAGGRPVEEGKREAGEGEVKEGGWKREGVNRGSRYCVGRKGRDAGTRGGERRGKREGGNGNGIAKEGG